MSLTNFKEISFEHVPDWMDSDYMDNDVILYSDVRDLPFKDDVLKTNMVTIAVCLKGKIRLDANASQLQLQQNDIFVCLPNVYVKNAWLSADFECGILCLSPRIVTNFIPENRLWDKLNMLSAHPVIHIDNDNLHIFDLYHRLLDAKMKAPASGYKKEILYSIIKTCLLELLEIIHLDEPFKKEFSRKEILFKNFIKLLSGVEVKPRSLGWYAERLFVSPKHLSTVCKEVSGQTAYYWVNEYVVNDIKHLLMNSDMSIKEMADYYHFPSSSFFCKYVKEHTGCSPGEYRRSLIDDRNASQI